MIDRHHHLLGVEPQALRQRLERVDRRAVDGGLAGLAQAAVADADAEALEQALERGRPAVHRRGLDHLGREERRRDGGRRRHPGARRYNAGPEAAIPKLATSRRRPRRSADPAIRRARAGDRAARRRPLRRGRARLPRARIAGYRAVEGPAPRRRRQRAGRAGPGAGGARSPARGGPLPAPRAARSWPLRPLGRSRHRAAHGPRAHGAGAASIATLGAYAAADRGYRTALAEIRRRFGPRDRYIAGVLNDLGVLRKAQGRYAEALAFYRRALPLVPRGDRHALRDAGPQPGRHRARARQLRGAPSRTRAGRSACARRWSGATHPAGRRRRRGAGRDRRGARPPGRGRRPLPPRAGGVRTRARPDAASRSASTSPAWPPSSSAASAPTRARALYARALAIQERVLGRHHADVAMTVNNLAVLERDDGNLERAAALFRRALGSFVRTLGARHPHARARAGQPPRRRARDRARRAHAAPPDGPQETRADPPMNEYPMRDPQLDLVLRGGTVVTAEGQRQADVGIRDGRVASSSDRGGGDRARRGAREIDADGTAAAARRRRPARPPAHARASTRASRPGSTTTRAARRPRWPAASPASATCPTCCPGRRIADRVRAEETLVARQAIADVFFHTVIVTPGAALVDEVGPRRARRPVEHEDLHVHADVRRQRAAVHARR